MGPLPELPTEALVVLGRFAACGDFDDPKCRTRDVPGNGTPSIGRVDHGQQSGVLT